MYLAEFYKLMLKDNLMILKRGQETMAITAATEIAVAKGQTTKKQPMAIKKPNRTLTITSTLSLKERKPTSFGRFEFSILLSAIVDSSNF